MKNLSQLMKQAQEMQDKMADMQNRLADLQVEGVSGGGMVKVVLNGKGEMNKVSVDPSLFKPEDAEVVEDLIVAAHADAKRKVEAAMAEQMSELTGGLPLPPGFKLPFG